MTANTWSERRIAGIAGIGFVILLVAAFAVSGDAPAPSFDDPANVREFFVDNATRVHLVNWLFALTFVFFYLPFAAGLRNLLASDEAAEEQIWSRLSYTGAVLATAIAGIGSAFWEVLSSGGAENLSDDALVALALFDSVIFLVALSWALALFLSAASIAIFRSQVLPRWIGWLGAISALLLIIGVLWTFSEDQEGILALIGFVGQVLTLIWMLVVGIAMVRGVVQPSASHSANPARLATETAGADLSHGYG